jgi:hypothetical protein
MNSTSTIQERLASAEATALVKRWLKANKGKTRTALARHVCEALDLKDARGQLRMGGVQKALRVLESQGRWRLAVPHRQVLGISTQDQALLFEYLTQLDGQPENPDAASIYDAWVAQQGLTGNDALPNSHTDSDFNPNFGEYYFDTDPRTNDAGGILTPNVKVLGSNVEFTVTFRRSTYAFDSYSVVQMSTNLTTWANLIVSGETVIETILDPDLDGDDTAELVEMRV